MERVTLLMTSGASKNRSGSAGSFIGLSDQSVDPGQRLLDAGLERHVPGGEGFVLLDQGLVATAQVDGLPSCSLDTRKRCLDPLQCFTDRRLFHRSLATGKQIKRKQLALVVHNHFDVLLNWSVARN
ncbi:hypothetical protein [Novosphingobium mathurense]|uniref:hypothetical protein n=1 Tax=Novosphingobium mathurense TaxID=428990 RepID=UPI0015919173|nr:hypothetical protein [Novosphingobium mathurense]